LFAAILYIDTSVQDCHTYNQLVLPRDYPKRINSAPEEFWYEADRSGFDGIDVLHQDIASPGHAGTLLRVTFILPRTVRVARLLECLIAHQGLIRRIGLDEDLIVLIESSLKRHLSQFLESVVVPRDS
ncbi:hypothetical protein AVEN_151600-1, partial [Araneus ventricosus]